MLYDEVLFEVPFSAKVLCYESHCVYLTMSGLSKLLN